MKHILLTGRPAVGKTTVLQCLAGALVAQLSPSAVKGFVTEEVRSMGVRQGFKISTIPDGSSGCMLASVATGDPRERAMPTVSKYVVHLPEFENVALPIVAIDPATTVLLVDEIGKMETFSTSFVQAMEKALEQDRCVVVCTVALNGGGFIASVKKKRNVELIEVTRENRNTLSATLLETVLRQLKK